MSTMIAEEARARSNLPGGAALEELLGLTISDPVILQLVEEALTLPVADFLRRPGKEIRAEAVRIGSLAMQHGPSSPDQEERCRVGSEVLEVIHAGSLIIDDIQDDSAMRRGDPALHRKYGLPVALNAGNWLYFFPFEKIRQLDLSPEQELRLYRDCHHTLLRAHYGQALDVGVPMDQLAQEKIYPVCRATMELKSGALMMLAFRLGALLGLQHVHESAAARVEAEARISGLGDFGHSLGLCLQMLNDVGNLTSPMEVDKQKEDLFLQRPSWIWGVAANVLSPERYGEFMRHVKNVSAAPEALDAFIKETGLSGQASRLALAELHQALAGLKPFLVGRPGVFLKAEALVGKLTRAYE